jgi:hypothetical protein
VRNEVDFSLSFVSAILTFEPVAVVGGGVPRQDVHVEAVFSFGLVRALLTFEPVAWCACVIGRKVPIEIFFSSSFVSAMFTLKPLVCFAVVL